MHLSGFSPPSALGPRIRSARNREQIAISSRNRRASCYRWLFLPAGAGRPEREAAFGIVRPLRRDASHLRGKEKRSGESDETNTSTERRLPGTLASQIDTPFE
jgi:hypothetical protein